MNASIERIIRNTGKACKNFACVFVVALSSGHPIVREVVNATCTQALETPLRAELSSMIHLRVMEKSSLKYK